MWTDLMREQPRRRIRMLTLAGALAFAAVTAHAQVLKGCVTPIDLATLGPKSIVGQGPNGEKAASVDQLQLTAEEIAKVKAGKFRVGITMQTVNLDWSQ